MGMFDEKIDKSEHDWEIKLRDSEIRRLNTRIVELASELMDEKLKRNNNVQATTIECNDLLPVFNKNKITFINDLEPGDFVKVEDGTILEVADVSLIREQSKTYPFNGAFIVNKWAITYSNGTTVECDMHGFIYYYGENKIANNVVSIIKRKDQTARFLELWDKFVGGVTIKCKNRFTS